MKTKDVALYIEHKWVKNYTIPANRSYILMAYIVYGQGIVEIENRKTDVKEKDIFVVNPNTSVKFISKNSQKENYDFEIHYLLFEKDFLRGEWERYADEFIELERFFYYDGKNYIVVRDNDKNEIRNYIVRLTNEYYEDAPARNSALLGNMLAMLPIIFRRYNVEEDQLFSKNTLVDQTIRQIRNTIYQNLKPSEIAAHRFVTVDPLGRVFKQETGMTA